MILYTSGTTGAPKGVLLSRNAIAAGIEGLADAWSWTAEDTVVHGLPCFTPTASSSASSARCTSGPS